MIDKITIHATTATYHHTSWEYKPEGVTAAQMNMQYVVAVTALEGNIFIDQFSEEKVKDPRIIAFSRKVDVTPDPDLDKLGPEFRHAIIAEITTKDRRTFSERVDTAKGSSKKPMTYEEVMIVGQQMQKKEGDRVLNDYLRAPGYGARSGPRLAGELFRGFARPPRSPE